MNKPAHEKVRTNDYDFRDAAVALNEPHSGLVNDSPSAKVALKCANNEKEDCHQQRANEEHRTSAPLVNI